MSGESEIPELTVKKVIIAIVCFVVLLLGCSDYHQYKNIYLISIDTLRADHLGSYGNENIKTPNIDRLAREGTLMEEFFAPVPLTLPSHSSMLTGTSPLYHNIRVNGNSRLNGKINTLAEMLSKEGYKCGAFIGAFPLDSIFGLDQGFDIYNDNYPREDKNTPVYTGRKAAEVANDAVEWIERNGARKFVFLHLFDPHRPYTPPQPFENNYKGEIEYVDTVLGEFLDKLREKGALENSLIILTSDHGEDLGDHGEESHGYFIYDSTLRIPCIFRDSEGYINQNRVTDSPWGTVDITPTLLDILGIDISKEVQGESFSPLLRGEETTLERSALYCETMHPKIDYGYSPLFGIRYKGWKYIQAPKPELYNLNRDRAEKKNLVEKRSGKKKMLKRKFEKTTERLSAEETPETISVGGDYTEELASLGYLGGGGSIDQNKGDLTDPKDKLETRNLIVGVLTGTGKEEDNRFFEGLPVDMKDKSPAEKRSILIDRLEDIRKENPNNIQVQRYLMFLYKKNDNCSKSMKIVEELKSRSHKGVDLYTFAGNCLEELGKTKKAVEYYRKAVEKSEYALGAGNEIGVYHMKNNRTGKALKIFSEIIEKDANNLEARVNRGFINLDRKNYNRAYRDFKNAYRREPGNPKINSGIGMVYAQIRPEKSIRYLKRAIQFLPEDSRLYYNLGMVYLKLGNPKRAKQVLKKALQFETKESRIQKINNILTRIEARNTE